MGSALINGNRLSEFALLRRRRGQRDRVASSAAGASQARASSRRSCPKVSSSRPRTTRPAAVSTPLPSPSANRKSSRLRTTPKIADEVRAKLRPRKDARDATSPRRTTASPVAQPGRPRSRRRAGASRTVRRIATVADVRKAHLAGSGRSLRRGNGRTHPRPFHPCAPEEMA